MVLALIIFGGAAYAGFVLVVFSLCAMAKRADELPASAPRGLTSRHLR